MTTITGADDNMGKGENYGKFKVDNSATMGEGRTDTPLGPEPSKGQQFGQIKYAKRGGYDSIYNDSTRDTQNDIDAETRAAQPAGGEGDESEEEQGVAEKK